MGDRKFIADANVAVAEEMGNNCRLVVPVGSNCNLTRRLSGKEIRQGSQSSMQYEKWLDQTHDSWDY